MYGQGRGTRLSSQASILTPMPADSFGSRAPGRLARPGHPAEGPRLRAVFWYVECLPTPRKGVYIPSKCHSEMTATKIARSSSKALWICSFCKLCSGPPATDTP